MTIEKVEGTDLEYHLIAHDKEGRERSDDPDSSTGRLSDGVRRLLREQTITDVFLASHGWKGDVRAAINQFSAWVGSMAQCEQDRRRIRQLRPAFKPLIIGLHWPSQPWGDESHSTHEAEDFETLGEERVRRLVDDAADKIADSDAAISALRTIFTAAAEDPAPALLPEGVASAFRTLVREAELGTQGPAGAPGDDAEAFDPAVAYQLATEADLEDRSAMAFGGGALKGGVLSVLRQLSFWTMKKRARTFGESGAANLLRALQRDVPGNRDVQFHLMGHSFGCIVVSATIAGGREELLRPVDSAYLVQGALSLWAYCSEIPVARGRGGYFHSIARDRKVAGPLLTTQSQHDTAVGKLYPIAAGVRRQVAFAPGELPRYGGLGAYGARGPGLTIEDVDMKVPGDSYGFAAGTLYNINADRVINEGGGPSGAHSDIAKPEVAHAFWEAVFTAARMRQAH